MEGDEMEAALREDEAELMPTETPGESPLQPPPQHDHPLGAHPFWSGVWNFVNGIVGAGIIGLAFAFESAGLWLGVAMLFVIAVLTQFSIDLLVKTGVRANKLHYEALCQHLFGPAGFYTAAACMWTFAAGAMLAYLVLIGDTVPVVLLRLTGVEVLGQRRLVTFLCAVLVCLPLSAFRDIGRLGHTSFLSIFAVCIIVVLVAIRAPATAAAQHIRDLPEQVGAYDFLHPRYAQAFGTFCFAFVCQHASFLVRNSLAKPAQWTRVSVVAIGIATALSLALASVGYGNFLRCTRSNILNNLEATDIMANVARLLLAFTMFLTYPMEFFVARQAIQSILHHLGVIAGPQHAHWPITAAQFVFTLLGGLFLPQVALGPILEFSGGFSAVMLGFVLPGACHLKYCRDHRVPLRAAGPLATAVGAGCLVVFGSVAAVTSTYFNVLGLLQEPLKYPPWCPLTGVET
eukprot:EG_transcript_9931